MSEERAVMKLKDVIHVETFIGKNHTTKFYFHNNRFRLFDKKGRELNSYAMLDVENVLNLKVLETKESKCSNVNFSIYFPVTHIKLDFLDDSKLSSRDFNFGDYDARG